MFTMARRSGRRFGFSTVRVRTTITASAVVGTALILSAFALVGILQHAMVNSVDGQIALRADDIAANAASGLLPQRLAGGIDDDTVAQALNRSGRVIAQSNGIRGDQPIADIPSAISGDTIHTVHRPPMGDGAAYRVLIRRVSTAHGPITLLIGGSLERTRDSTNTVIAVLAVGIPALVLLVGALAWWMVGKTLKPVEHIRREVAEISSHALDRRIPEPHTADEIGRLARTMNDMLERLEASRSHEQRFVADAAHELRSPLTNVRTQLEVALAHPESTDWAVLSASVLDQHERIGRLVEDLLVLAQADDHKLGERRRTVDLDEIILGAVKPIRDRGRVRVDLTGVTGGRVAGNRTELERVIQNLLDNAERHADSTVRIAVESDDTVVRLVIDDDGPGIAPADRVRAFDRFSRLDDDRSRAQGGTGLGLAIVKEIVQAHDGTVQITVPPDRPHGTRVQVTLPGVVPSGE
jgi:signal transduction histidine kinase